MVTWRLWGGKGGGLKTRRTISSRISAGLQGIGGTSVMAIWRSKCSLFSGD